MVKRRNHVLLAPVVKRGRYSEVVHITGASYVSRLQRLPLPVPGAGSLPPWAVKPCGVALMLAGAFAFIGGLLALVPAFLAAVLALCVPVAGVYFMLIGGKLLAGGARPENGRDN